MFIISIYLLKIHYIRIVSYHNDCNTILMRLVSYRINVFINRWKNCWHEYSYNTSTHDTKHMYVDEYPVFILWIVKYMFVFKASNVQIIVHDWGWTWSLWHDHCDIIAVTWPPWLDMDIQISFTTVWYKIYDSWIYASWIYASRLINR